MGFVQRRIVNGVLAVVAHPKLTLAIAGLVLAASILGAYFFLPVSTNQNDLFSPTVPFFRDWLDFVDKFPENESLYVIVESREPDHPPDMHRWAVAADAIDVRLRALPQYVAGVETRVTSQQMGPYGLLFDDKKTLPQHLDEFVQFSALLKQIAQAPNLDALTLGTAPIQRFLNAMNLGATFRANQFADSAPITAAIAQSWIDTLHAPPATPPVLPDIDALGAQSPRDLGYSYVPDQTNKKHHILLIAVHYIDQFNSLTSISNTVDSIRAAVTAAAAPFPEFKVGVTGRPALDADEMRTTDNDSHKAEIIALSLVFVLLVIMFRSLWLALAAEISLAVGIGWTFGWATLSVHKLNLLSTVFVIALIGIGMDYLIQILFRFRHESAKFRRPKALWSRVFRYVSPPILTACLGASGAFLVSILTDFKGAAELGIIAGGGLLLCLLAGYTVLPALLVLIPPRVPKLPAPKRSIKDDHPRARWHYFLGPALWLALLLAGARWAFKTEFNPNLLSLQADNLESVQLVHKLQTWSAVELSKDLHTLARVRAAVEQPDLGQPDLVERTESVLNAAENAQWLMDHQQDVPKIAWAAPKPLEVSDLPKLAATARTLAAKYKPLQGLDPAHADQTLRAFADALDAAQTDPQKAAALTRLNDWQPAFIDQLQGLAAQFSPPPLDVSRLPDQLRNHLISKDGTYALYIWPKEDLWQAAPLEAFVKHVESRVASLHDPAIPAPTGITMDIYHSTASIQSAFVKAAIYAFVLIVILVWLDLRQISHTLLALSVLALGLPMLIILMGLTGDLQSFGVTKVSWNFANFFGLPILIGAGHEYGVFMIHRYRETLHDPRRAWRGWDPSDRALLLCGLVTSCSFGFFWLVGHHKGLISLGWVMMVGTASIYIATLLVLRPLLLWRLNHKPPNPNKSQS